MGMEKTIYIIRHGETDLNKKGIMQGRGVNASLNEVGRLQAEAFYQKYKHVPFNKIYTSTLLRTHETVQRFIDMGIPWTQFAGLDEMAWGIYEGQEATDDIKMIMENLMQSWYSGNLHLKCEQGESPMEVNKRQLEILEVLTKDDGAENILLCMHGRAMRLFLCLLLDLPLSEMHRFPHQNTALYKVKYDGKTFAISEFNNTQHLDKHLEKN